jgi:hypothetical protein
MTTDVASEIEAYLSRVDQALGDLPRARRLEIVDGLREHIHDGLAAEPDLGAILARLGSPEQIAAAAGEPLEQPPRRRPGALEIATLALLGPGVVLLPLFGPLVGLVTMWLSKLWGRRDKTLVSALMVGDVALVALLVVAAALAGRAGSDTGATVLLVALMVAMALGIWVLPLVGAVLLARKVWPDRFAPVAGPTPAPVPGGPAAAGGPGRPGRRLVPGRPFYLVAVLFGVVAAVALWFAVAHLSGGFPGNGTRVGGPATARVTLPEAGAYLVALEGPASSGGPEPAVDAPSDLTLTAVGTGRPVPVRPVSSGFSYGTGDREGHAVARFTIEQPGEYEFSSSYPGGRAGPPATFVIGLDTTGGFVLGLLALFASVGALVLAITCAIAVLLLRSSAWRRPSVRGPGL